jgi:hypothetical protein
LLAVAGDHLYEVHPGGTTVDRSTPGFSGASGVGTAGGPIGNDNLPAQIFANGNQILVISAGMAYCDNGNGPVPVQFSDPLTDLLVDPSYTDGRTLTTATGGFFDQTDVGRTVLITEGVGFNVGLSQVILSVHADGGAVGAAPWGSPGSGLGVGIEYKSISYTDLELVHPYQVHSSSRVFGPSEVGLSITITSGTGWTPGTYTISGLVYDILDNPTGDAVIVPNAGVAGATGGVGTIDEMPVTASYGAFLDGYFFVIPNPPTKTVYFSQINDGTSWNPLDFFVKANYPDNAIALFADHQELYVMGNLESTQVMRDMGDADNPFAPDPGAVMHYGCQAKWSVVRLGNGVAWIGIDVRRGGRKAFHAVGYNPVAVSTPAVEAEWAKYSTIEDAVAYTMMDRGHECWVITFPSAGAGGATWCYDATTGWWHQRGWWNSARDNWDRVRTWVHAVVNLNGTELHYGGDWENDRVYVIGTNYLTDDGSMMFRRRRAPQLTLENMRRFYARFEIDCDVEGTGRIFWNRLGCARSRIWQLDTQQSTETGDVTFYLAFSDDRTQTWQYMAAQYVAGMDVMLSNAYLNDVNATWH